ncbi:MAG: hypothetical protein C7B43_14530 [Sulfobacillus benefaciens]|jgi:hypothetical protein|uniref:Uncharacterized protein n=1 Tax=Sulfobacillus benefaciens TaxID=453960 RepID=A0A2T2WVA8_9FIRM|nr:MAG: hypothetical protein C7B43_14530 [Sulfobacillus benefaciens]
MRIWLIWPQVPQERMLSLIQAVGGQVVQTDELLDRAQEHLATVEADVVIVNSLTPGTDDLVDWLIRRKYDREDLRWVVAFPSLAEYPRATRWLYLLLRAQIFDWVFEGDTFTQDLQHRLITPWKWSDAVTVLGGPDAIRKWDEALSGDRPDAVRSPDEGPIFAAAPAEPAPPGRREVVVVSPAKPVIIAVASLAPGMGASCAAAGMAERLEALHQPSVLVELAKVRTQTFADWQPALQATVAGPDDRWDLLPVQRKWSYILVDCHTLWQSLPVFADLIVLVGPGHWHRWGYWSDWERGVREGRKGLDVAKGQYLVAPGPQAAEIQKRLKDLEGLAGMPIACAPDVFADPASAAWDAILAPVLPALPDKTRRVGRSVLSGVVSGLFHGTQHGMAWAGEVLGQWVERVRARHTQA